MYCVSRKKNCYVAEVFIVECNLLIILKPCSFRDFFLFRSEELTLEVCQSILGKEKIW
jgi:hypothetical protein